MRYKNILDMWMQFGSPLKYELGHKRPDWQHRIVHCSSGAQRRLHKPSETHEHTDTYTDRTDSITSTLMLN